MNSEFKWDAEDYAKNSTGQLALADELINRFSPAPHHRILDVGCGDGKITRKLSQLVPDGVVMGIDRSENMIDYAKANFQSGNLSFACMDAANIQLSEKFDWVFSNAALHWVPDQPAVISGIRSVLNPGGRILLQMGGAGNAEGLTRVIQNVQQDIRWRKYFADFHFPYCFPSIDEYSRWLSSAGFSIDRIELLDRSMNYTSAEDFAGWVRTAWFPMTDPLPVDERPIFIEQVVSAYCESMTENNGFFVSVPMKRLEVSAKLS